MSSPDVDVPGPSPEERALQQEQTEILRQQRDIIEQQVQQQQLLAPILYENAGVTPIMDDQGNIIDFERQEDPLDPLRQEIEQGFLERTQAALAGELPVNPALISDLDEQEQTLREQLRSQLGPGFETSTPGIEALAEFSQRKNELLEASRRGDLTLGEQLSLAREQAQEQRINQFLARGSGVNDFFGSGTQSLAQLAQGFGQGVQGFQNQRALTLQGNIAQAQAEGAFMQGIGQAVGTGVGIWAGMK